VATQRYYSSTAVDNNLAASINSAATSLTLNTLPIGYPSTFPFTIAIDYDNPLEELCQVTNLVGSTMTISRADAGNGTGTSGTAVGHSTGAVIRHVVTGQDLTDITNAIYSGASNPSSLPDVLMLFGG
jgi:hypothetical protein